MKLNNICCELEKIAPVNTCLAFDNVGLLVGDFEKDVKNVLIALDLREEVLEEAIDKNIDLIITHHPLLFNPPKKINTDTVTGRILLKLIKNDIAYYASHTNLDKAEFGTNTRLAQILELEDYSFIDNEDIILVTGNLNIKLNELINNIKTRLDLDYIRFVGDEKKEIKKVGIATGTGNNCELFQTAKACGVDILITGDLTYHNMQFAYDIGLNLIDATHFKTENLVTGYLKELLDKSINGINIIVSESQENIFKTL